jgi:GxxExxY protein
MLEARGLTDRIIGLAIGVHRTVGPGLLESVYRECLSDELTADGIHHQREVGIPVTFKGKTLPVGFRADIIVEDKVIIEVKAIDALAPVHEAQLLTYLRMSQIRVGLLMNFHAPRLKDGLRRFIM